MLTLKVLHIVLVSSWFATLFYLPRLLVNLAEDGRPDVQERLVLMARRLYRFSWFLWVPALGLGLLLLLQYFRHSGGWGHVKIVLALLLVVYQWYCHRLVGRFAEQQPTPSARFLRWFNEIPVLIMLVLVYLAVLKPF